MDSDLKKRWVEALRSGKYSQCSDSLRLDDSNGQVIGHCCLGVLVDIIDPTNWQTEIINWDGEPTHALWDGLDLYAPFEILDEHTQRQLAARNDGSHEPNSGAKLHKHTFGEIADYIEANL